MKMNTINLYLCIIFTILFLPNLDSQETISSGRLSITIENIGNGAVINNIKDNGTETINTATLSEFFTLQIEDINTENEYTISSASGWNNVAINNLGSSCSLQFSDPINVNLPNSLMVTLTIHTDDAKSDWDISVAGLSATHSLLDVVFPKLNIKADGNDTFLYPLYSGRLTHNPGSGIDYFDDNSDPGDNNVGLYPRGWGTTMQFFSYYNNNYGLYFGFHDPDASIKYFGVKNENSGVKIECKYPTPNKTVANNNWDLPGVFELDAFNGNWYEAAQIYKTWVSANSNYWPQDSPQRTTRQQSIGDIGVWLSTYVSELSMSQMQAYIQSAISFFDVPVGIHAYEWNNKEFDHFYPDYFPEITDFPSLVANIQNNNNAIIMPYTNGRMWDTGIGGNDADDPAAITYYNNNGLADATKRSDNTVITQTFKNNVFAVMCPHQNNWKTLIKDVEDEITKSNRIGAKALYLDMVTASGPSQCMDASHGHPLGGGSFWKEGYSSMLSSIHTTVPDDIFITTEGGCDFVADQVDAFMVQGWTTDNQVPAWQAIYTGKVQLFGTKTGGSQYGNQQFYAKLGQGYIFGVQTGRQYMWLAINPNSSPKKSMAANYVKRLSRMRYKLRSFMSYGEMKKPLELTGTIPDVTYIVSDWGGHKGNVDVTYPAVQNTVWQNGDTVVVSLINTSLPDVVNVIDDSLMVSFEFDGSDYGITGTLAVTEVLENSEGETYFMPNTFTQIAHIPSITPIAYLIRPATDLGNTYYVSTTGNNANSGTSEAQAWRTIAYAASNLSPVLAGDMVFIKAGNYGLENINIEKSGTVDMPILFEGYQTTIGDSPDLNHSFGDALDASIMPLLDGGDRATGGSAIEIINENFITIKNLQITKFNYGIYAYGASNLSLDNIIITEQGDIIDDYDGVGISLNWDNSHIGGNNNRISNCFVENAAAEGFSFAGNNNRVENCNVYCNEDISNSAMDYYIVLEGNNNIVSNCHAERIGTLDHDGHGIEFKGNCEHNKVLDCVSVNTGGLGVRHRGAQFNTFENCKSYDLFGYHIRDGASNNTFKNCEAINNLSAIVFYDTDEDGGAQYTGRNNRFENCIFRNSTENVIDFFYYDEESLCDNNTFANCVIDGGDYLFNCDRSNANNKLANCIVTNVNNYSQTAVHQGINYPLNIVLDHNNFFNNGFSAPVGFGIITSDPQFVDIVNHNYHLLSSSPCINAGIDTDAPNEDKNGTPRKLENEIDLGIYETGIYWTGVKGNFWRNSANWSTNQIPTSLDTVTIPPAQFYYNRPEAFNNSQVKTLFIYDNGQMVIKNGVLFDVND